MKFNISNDDIAKRAQELAAADGTIVWQRAGYIEKAVKQLEIEAEANLAEKRRNAKPAHTSAELIKATMAQDEAVEARIKKCGF